MAEKREPSKTTLETAAFRKYRAAVNRIKSLNSKIEATKDARDAAKAEYEKLTGETLPE